MNRLGRFAQTSGTIADHLAIHLAIARDDYSRMERRAEALKTQRDELAEALRNLVTSVQHFKETTPAVLKARAALAKVPA